MMIKTKKPVFCRRTDEIFALVSSFENCTLPLADWTHDAYLTVVFWYLYMNPLPDAKRLIRLGVKRYNFEHCIAPTAANNYEMSNSFWIRKVNECLAPSRNAKMFVHNLNLTLRQLSDQTESEIEKTTIFTPPGKGFLQIGGAS